MKKTILFTIEKNDAKSKTYLFNEWLSFNGIKFLYHIDIRNGWNPASQSISIMKSDGTWGLIATSIDIGCYEGNPYISPQTWVEYRQRLVKEFDNWLSKVYGS